MEGLKLGREVVISKIYDMVRNSEIRTYSTQKLPQDEYPNIAGGTGEEEWEWANHSPKQSQSRRPCA